MKWTPEILNNLYVDNSGLESLFFWYNDILKNHCDNNNKN